MRDRERGFHLIPLMFGRLCLFSASVHVHHAQALGGPQGPRRPTHSGPPMPTCRRRPEEVHKCTHVRLYNTELPIYVDKVVSLEQMVNQRW